MSRVVWTEHRPKLETSNRPASWTDQLDHGRFTNEDGCRHHQQSLKVEAPHFHPQEIDGNVPVQSVPISTPKTLTPQGLLPRRLRPSKVRAARWQTMWNSTMARNVEINFLHPKGGRWKPTIFCTQKDSTNPTNLSLRVKDLFNAWPPHFPGLNDFVPLCYCLCLKIPVQSVPISTPQNIGTSVSIGTAASA